MLVPPVWTSRSKFPLLVSLRTGSPQELPGKGAPPILAGRLSVELIARWSLLWIVIFMAAGPESRQMDGDGLSLDRF